MVARALAAAPRRGQNARGKRALIQSAWSYQNQKSLAIAGLFGFWGVGLGETDDSGSTKCDYEEHFGRQSAAAAPRRGESARGKRARDNPPGPTKIKTRLLVGFFVLGVGLDEGRCSTNSDQRSVWSAAAKRQAPEGFNRQKAIGD